MTTIEIELGVQDRSYLIEPGVQDRSYLIPKFDPSVHIEIRGDHPLVMEVLQHLDKFTSSSGQIEVK